MRLNLMGVHRSTRDGNQVWSNDPRAETCELLQVTTSHRLYDTVVLTTVDYMLSTFQQ